MPGSWTAEKDQKLLLTALELGMIDCNKLATAFSSKYGTNVSTRAVYQHLQKLSKKVSSPDANSVVGGTPKKATGTPKATPRKAAAPKPAKTPTSAGKRKNVSMSEDDDSEDERMVNGHDPHSPTPKRQQTNRRSKTPKTYTDPGSGEELDVEGAAGPSIKHEMNGDGLGHGAADRDVMSDVSDFDPNTTFT